MDIANNNIPTVAQAQPKVGSGTNINSDFETFLKLLTTQISNQDPLDPMKAEEFATQLATFSGVEQQVRTNELLAGLNIGGAGKDLATLTHWIGREVEAPMPLRFDGQTMTVTPPVSIAGDVHQLVVRDDGGREVYRATINGNGSPISWDGQTNDGRKAIAGSYQFTVESYDGSELVDTKEVAGFARVTEVRTGPNGPVLLTDTGAEVSSDVVSAVREAT